MSGIGCHPPLLPIPFTSNYFLFPTTTTILWLIHRGRRKREEEWLGIDRIKVLLLAINSYNGREIRGNEGNLILLK
jgi:hypothetical protein